MWGWGGCHSVWGWHHCVWVTLLWENEENVLTKRLKCGVCFCILLSVHGPHDCCGHIFCSVHDFMPVVAMCCSLHDFIHDCSGHISWSLHEDFITLKWPHVLFSPWGLHYSQVATCLVLSTQTFFMAVVAVCLVLCMRTSFMNVVAGCLVLSVMASFMTSGHMSSCLHDDFVHD